MAGMMTRKEFLKSLEQGIPAVFCIGEGWALGKVSVLWNRRPRKMGER